jgi:RNA polymerase primary sigma factor
MYAFLEQANERVPSAEEIAKELDMTISDVKESMKNSGRHVSMDAPLVEGEDSNLYDVLRSGESPNPDRNLLHESLRTEIERALETLTPREADVVRLYFGLGEKHAMTLEEIGETFDLTRERVRQIKEKAIRRLKHTSRSKILKTYLG